MGELATVLEHPPVRLVQTLVILIIACAISVLLTLLISTLIDVFVTFGSLLYGLMLCYDGTKWFNR